MAKNCLDWVNRLKMHLYIAGSRSFALKTEKKNGERALVTFVLFKELKNTLSASRKATRLLVLNFKSHVNVLDKAKTVSGIKVDVIIINFQMTEN